MLVMLRDTDDRTLWVRDSAVEIVRAKINDAGQAVDGAVEMMVNGVWYDIRCTSVVELVNRINHYQRDTSTTRSGLVGP